MGESKETRTYSFTSITIKSGGSLETHMPAEVAPAAVAFHEGEWQVMFIERGLTTEEQKQAHQFAEEAARFHKVMADAKDADITAAYDLFDVDDEQDNG